MCGRKRLAFGCENAGLERTCRIVVADFDRALQDNGAVIVLVIDEVHGAAGDLGAVTEHSSMHGQAIHPPPTERWDERRVDVDDAVLEVRWNGHVLEKAAHDDVLSAGVATGTKDGVAEGGRCR